MFIVPTLDEIRSAILRDVLSLNQSADISVDSDSYARASALAAIAEGLYAHQKWMIKQFFPDTADTLFLEKHCSLRGIYRKNATYADGLGATISGNEGSVIAEGLSIKTEDGRFYQTVGETTIGSEGVAVVRVRSLATGSSQNITARTVASFMSAPKGIQSEVILNDVVGAVDEESDSSLLERLLELIRRPPAGGNKYDYKNWALSIDGVDAAYVYPLRRGLGTVDIVITSNNGIPSEDTIERVQRYIDDVRPVTAKESKVIKPSMTKVNFNIKVKLARISLPEAQREIEKVLSQYFNTLIPGDNLIISQCEALVSDIIGVVDRHFVTPTVNKQADIQSKIEWFRLGTITVSEF